jgi:hypothetical protein
MNVMTFSIISLCTHLLVFVRFSLNEIVVNDVILFFKFTISKRPKPFRFIPRYAAHTLQK